MSPDIVYGISFTTGTDCATNPLNTFCNVSFLETP
jgi:hypothetical protein